MLKFFSLWGKPADKPVVLPALVQNMGMQAQPLLINEPAGSPLRTLRCLHRMVRVHMTLDKYAHDPSYCEPFRAELARAQALLLLSGDTGPMDVESLKERIAALEAK